MRPRICASQAACLALAALLSTYALAGAVDACPGPVVDHHCRSGHRHRRGDPRLQGNPLRRTAQRTPALARAAAAPCLAGRARRNALWRRLHADALRDPHRSEAERGLPDRERLDPGSHAGRASAGDGIHLRWRIHRRLLRLPSVRRHEARRPGRGRRLFQLPCRDLRLPRAPHAVRGIAPSFLRQLRPARPDRRA